VAPSSAALGVVDLKSETPPEWSDGVCAGWTGLEPAASGVTGRKLHHNVSRDEFESLPFRPIVAGFQTRCQRGVTAGHA
jgi:hypothetical protein